MTQRRTVRVAATLVLTGACLAYIVWRIDLGYTERGASGPLWEHWQGYTLAVIEVGMWFVIVLTILSLIDYLVDYRHLWSKRAG